MPAQVHEPFEAAHDNMVDPKSYEQNDISSIEPSTPENDQNEHGKKKSVIGKVKDKAKKLKSKIKSSSRKKSGDEDGSNASGSDDSDEENEENSTSSSDSERIPPTDEVDGTEAAVKAEKGGDTYETDHFATTTNAPDSFGTHSVLQERENEPAEDPSAPTPGVESMESDYNNDLRAPEEKTPLESDYNNDLRAPEENLPLESEAVNVQQNVPAALEQSSAEIDDGLRFRELKPDADGASSDGYSKSNNDSAIESVLPEVPVAASSDELTSQGDATLVNKGDEYLDSFTGTEVNADGETLPLREDANANEQTLTEKAAQTVSAAKGAALENLGYGGKEANPADYFLSGSSEKSDRGEQCASESENSAKDAVSTNLGLTTSESDADLSKSPQTTPENGSSTEAMQSGNLQSAGHYPSSNVNEPLDVDSRPTATDSAITNKVKETAQTFAGSIASTLGYNSSSSTHDDPIASKPVNSEDKTVTQKIFDSVAAAKETVASNLGYASSINETTDDKGDSDTSESMAVSDQSPSVTQRVSDSANSNLAQVKDTVTAGTGKAKEALNSGISQAKNGTVSAKDSTVSRFHPGEEDESLSEKITHFLSPSHIKDALVGGFSSKTAEDTNPPAQGKGVISRVTDAVSSLLGSKSPKNEDPRHQQLHDQEKQAGEQIGENLSSNSLN